MLGGGARRETSSPAPSGAGRAPKESPPSSLQPTPAPGPKPPGPDRRIGGLLQLLDQLQRAIEHSRRIALHEIVLYVDEPAVLFHLWVVRVQHRRAEGGAGRRRPRHREARPGRPDADRGAR